MNRKRIQSLLEKGKEKLEQDGVKSVGLVYCPICDDEEWKVFQIGEVFYISELGCRGAGHEDKYFHQEFCDYYKDVYELETLLKYLEL